MPDPDGRWGSQEASASRPADALRELGEPAQLKETLENEMSALPEVSEINTTTGREDLLVRPATESHASLQELIERLLSICDASLGVLPGEVGQPADGWVASDGGVGSVMVVLVDPAR